MSDRTTELGPGALRELLEIPEDLEPVALTPLGYPAEGGKFNEREPLDQITTWV